MHSHDNKHAPRQYTTYRRTATPFIDIVTIMQTNEIKHMHMQRRHQTNVIYISTTAVQPSFASPWRPDHETIVREQLRNSQVEPAPVSLNASVSSPREISPEWSVSTASKRASTASSSPPNCWPSGRRELRRARPLRNS